MKVSVCDLKSVNFYKDFQESAVNTGFAVITDHGIDFGLIKETQAAWKSFFTSPLSNQELFINKNDSNMGYRRFGDEKAVGSSKADLKSFYHWRPGENLPAGVFNLTEKLFSSLEGEISHKLLDALRGFGSVMNYSEVCKESNNTILRAIYYPALKEVNAEKGAVRAAEHTDINFLTLLVAASAPGLQVKNNEGEWFNVPFEENSIVVNIGDQLQLASNGVLKSTVHRVVNPNNDSSDRLSIPLFVHAKGETILLPGITAQQYLNQRLNEIYKGGYK